MHLQGVYLDQLTCCPYKNTKAQPRKARSGAGALFVPGFKTPRRKTQPFSRSKEAFAKPGRQKGNYGGLGRERTSFSRRR